MGYIPVALGIGRLLLPCKGVRAPSEQTEHIAISFIVRFDHAILERVIAKLS